jgi:hypothetical protein
MTSTIWHLTRAGRRVGGQIKRLHGEELKIAYNVRPTASMVSIRVCCRVGTTLWGRICEVIYKLGCVVP